MSKRLCFTCNPVENVFLEVEPILRSALDGNNVCILSYGLTGTGKTLQWSVAKLQIEPPSIVKF